jgi:hypothetical protein
LVYKAHRVSKVLLVPKVLKAPREFKASQVQIQQFPDLKASKAFKAQQDGTVQHC